MLSSRDCPSSKASLSIVASLLQSSEELHAPPSDISVSYGLGSGSQTSSYRPRLSLAPVHQFVDQLYFGLLKERHGRLFGQVFQKGRERLSPPDAGAIVSFYEEVKRFAV